MKFDKQIAGLLIEQFGLSPGTLRTWQSRGAIPDKYAFGLLPLRIVASRVNPLALRRFQQRVADLPEPARQYAEIYLDRPVSVRMEQDRCAQRFRDFIRWAKSKDWETYCPPGLHL